MPHKTIFALALTMLLFISKTNADHVPGHAYFEWGIGLTAITSPDYIGSSRQQSFLLPFPYLKYRGEILRVDDGIEGRLFKTPDLLLSISGNGSLPSPEDNPEREGMRKLDATFEVGPALEYRISGNDNTEVWFELPLRFGFRANSDLNSIGYTSNPRVAWRKMAQGRYDWKLKLTSGFLFADADFHGYFYNIAEDEVTTTRPRFTAQSGYSGWRTDFTFSRRFENLWFGGFFRYDDLHNSEIEQSPLVNRDHSITAGLSIAWIIGED